MDSVCARWRLASPLDAGPGGAAITADRQLKHAFSSNGPSEYRLGKLLITSVFIQDAGLKG